MKLYYLPLLLVTSAALGNNRSVPPGFESLLLGQVEQVEINIGGRPIGLFSVEVKPDTIKIEDPNAVLIAAELDHLSSETKGEILKLLSSSMLRNSHLACNNYMGTNCNYIKTDGIAAIFNEKNGVLSLFTRQEWLRNSNSASRFYNVTQSTVNAFIHKNIINFSLDRNNQSVSIAGADTQGIGKNSYVATDWVLTKNNNQSEENTQGVLNNLYLRNDIGNKNYWQVGRMDERDLYSPLGGSFGYNFIPICEIHGLRVGSTDAYINPKNNNSATPLMVLVNSPSRVDVYRGKQLISSQYIQSGFQQLSTNNFPNGSYFLNLYIYESNVLIRNEQQHFSKTTNGINSRAGWFAQFGKAFGNTTKECISNEQSAYTSAGGITLNLLSNLQITNGVSTANGNVYNETKIETQLPINNGVLNASGSTLSSGKGIVANSQQLSYAERISLSIYRQQQNDVQNDIPGYTSMNYSMSVPLSTWYAGLMYSESKTEKLKSKYYTSTVIYEQPSRFNKSWQVSLTKSFRFRDLSINGRSAFFTRQYDTTKDNGFLLGFSVTHLSSSANNGGNVVKTLSTDMRNGSQKENSYGFGYTNSWQNDSSYNEFGVNLSGNSDRTINAAVGVRKNNGYGDLKSTLTYAQQNDINNTASVFGSYSSSMSLSQGGFYFGSASGNGLASGVAFRVEGDGADSSDKIAQISSNNIKHIGLGHGDKLMIPIDSYQLENIHLSDFKNSRTAVASIASGTGNKEYFLLPGRLAIRVVNADFTWTWVGRALDNNNIPLKGAKVLNQEVSDLDEYGRFTLQSKLKLQEFWLLHGGKLLRCPLDVKSTRDVLRIVGNTRCEEASSHSLPQALKMTPRVMKLLAKVRG